MNKREAIAKMENIIALAVDHDLNFSVNIKPQSVSINFTERGTQEMISLIDLVPEFTLHMPGMISAFISASYIFPFEVETTETVEASSDGLVESFEMTDLKCSLCFSPMGDDRRCWDCFPQDDENKAIIEDAKELEIELTNKICLTDGCANKVAIAGMPYCEDCENPF